MVEIVEGFIPMPGATKRFYETCVRCHICVRGCPRRAISVDEENFPIVAEGRPRDTLCEICGTCLAICPMIPGTIDAILMETLTHYPTRTKNVPPPETHAPMLPPDGERFVE